MGQQDEQLCTAFAKMAVRCLVQFNTQDLANTAWALAVADKVASAWCVLPDGAWPRQQHARSGDAIGHSLLCSLVLTTKASCTCQRHGLSRRWARSMGFSDGGPEAWAFATVGQKHGLLFSALGMAAARRMGALYKPQELANTFLRLSQWGFSCHLSSFQLLN